MRRSVAVQRQQSPTAIFPASTLPAQGGQQQMSALFTFVARDAITGKAFAINAVQPRTVEVGQGLSMGMGLGEGLGGRRAAAGGAGRCMQ